MTATANNIDRRQIKESLGLENCFELVANPDRSNIFYEKIFRHGQDIDAFEDICRPIAIDLLNMKINYPLTIIYMPLKWCGFVYRLFESILDIHQYYHRQPNVMVACAQAHVAQARDCIVVLFPKVGKCNQTNDTYTFKQSKILQISLQLR